MIEIFVPQRFHGKSERMLVEIKKILDDYASQGYSLSVRQLYYQLVTRNIIANKHQEYKNLISLVSNARLAGRIDWDAIVDRARALLRPRNWEDASAAIRWVQGQFQIDKWRDQPWHVEVMVEKQALEGVIEPVCSRLDVAFTSNKGYSSQTMMYEAGKRMEERAQAGKKILICYLGDHDPSGIDMTRDIVDRLHMFSRQTEIRVSRLALNMAQVRQYKPPENPTKQTDSRTVGYVSQFGTKCWELDALEPSVLSDLISRAILKVRDDKLWEKACADEARQITQLETMAEECRTGKNAADLDKALDEVENLKSARKIDNDLWDRAQKRAANREKTLLDQIETLKKTPAKKGKKK